MGEFRQAGWDGCNAPSFETIRIYDGEKLKTQFREVTREGKRIVYVVQGHGEHELGSSERAGFSEAKGALEKSNYEVKSLALALKAAIPDDAAVVVIAGPRTDLFAPEVDALDRYLAKGGKVLAMVDPPFPGKMQDAVIKRFLGRWGVELGDNLVVELCRGGAGGGDLLTPPRSPAR